MGEPAVVACSGCGARNRVPAEATGTPHCAKCRRALPWVVDAGEHDYGRVVDGSHLPVLVDLWAPWCGPCRMVSPALEQLAGEFAGQVKLVKVNVDEAPGVSQRFGVQGIPTLLVSHRGEVLARQTGAAPESALRRWLQDALRSVERTEP